MFLHTVRFHHPVHHVFKAAFSDRCGVRHDGDGSNGCGSVQAALENLDEGDLDGVFSIKMTRQESYGNLI